MTKYVGAYAAVLGGLDAGENTDRFVDHRTAALAAFLADARVKETV